MRTPDRLLQNDLHRFHARMLLDRGRSGDRERAYQMRNEAFEGYGQMGMRGHAEIVKSLMNL